MPILSSVGMTYKLKKVIIMKNQNGFTLMNKNEIASYLGKQKVTRKITKLQVQ